MRWNSSRSKLWLCEINLFTLNSWNFDGPEYYLHKNNRYAKLFHGYLAAVARPPARPRQLQQPACLPGAAAAILAACCTSAAAAAACLPARGGGGGLLGRGGNGLWPWWSLHSPTRPLKFLAQNCIRLEPDP